MPEQRGEYNDPMSSLYERVVWSEDAWRAVGNFGHFDDELTELTISNAKFWAEHHKLSYLGTRPVGLPGGPLVLEGVPRHELLLIGFDSNIYEAKFEQRDLIPLDTADRRFIDGPPHDFCSSGPPGKSAAAAAASVPPFTRLQHSRDISLEEIAARQANALVAGVLLPGEAAGLYAPTGAGKSFVAGDLGWHVALKKPWHGRRVTRAPVLYVALEGKDGFRKRMKAMEQTLGDPGDWFALLTVHAPLDKGKTGEAGMKEIIAAAKELEAKCGQPVGLIVIDTYARAIAGDDENSAAESMAYLEKRAGEIKRQTGATVLTLYHPNKQGDLRGSTATGAGLDVVLRIDRQRTTRTLIAEKLKDGEDRTPLFDFQLETFDFGTVNAEGEPVTSCIVRSSPHQRRKRDEPTDKGEAALHRAFDELVEAGKGEAGPMPGSGELGVSLSFEAVRKRFVETYGGKPSAARMGWARIKEALPADFAVDEETGVIWRLEG